MIAMTEDLRMAMEPVVGSKGVIGSQSGRPSYLVSSKGVTSKSEYRHLSLLSTTPSKLTVEDRIVLKKQSKLPSKGW